MSISGVGSSALNVRSFQPPTFKTLDSNSSGDITLDELKSGAPGGASDAKSAARAEKLFNAMDADGSGSVSSTEKDTFDTKVQERQQAMNFMAQQMSGGMRPPSNDDIFAATDADSSGSVSLEEFSSSDAADELSSKQLSELFSTIDGDGDGTITESESSAFLESLKEAAGGQQGGPPPGGPRGAGGPPPGGPPPDNETEESDDEDTTAIDLLTAATTAYSSSQKSNDLLSVLSSIFDEAA